MNDWYFIHTHHMNINDYLLTVRARRKIVNRAHINRQSL